MAQKFIGIDLGSQQVKIAVVRAGLRRAQVVDLFSVPVVADAEAADGGPTEAALKAALTALRGRGLLGEALAIALPATALSYRLLEFPFADERRIAQALAFEAEGQFPVPLDELAHGHVVVPGPTNTGRALMVAAPRAVVDLVATVCKRAGCELKCVTAATTSLPAAIEADPGSATAELTAQQLSPVTLVVDLGHSSTEIIAVGAKGPMAVRTLRRGARQVTAAVATNYGLDQQRAEQAKQRDGFVAHRGHGDLTQDQLRAASVVAQALDPIIREIEHTRMWLRASYRCEAVRVVLCGGGAHLRGIAGYFGEHLELPVTDAVLRTQGVGRGLVLPAGMGQVDAASYAAALGVALAGARRSAVQLHDAMGDSGDGGWVQERVASLALIGLIIIGLGAVDTIVQVKAIESERAAWEQELATAATKVFGEAVAAGEVKRRLDEVEGQDLTSLMPQRGALEVLAQLAQAVRPSDLGRVPVPVPGAPNVEGDDPDSAVPAADDAAEAAAVAGTTAGETFDLKQGVVMSDALVLQMVDIRERKIELKLEAVRASAQDRVAYRLRDIACLSNIEKGKVKGDARKVFEMTMDNNCFFGSLLGSGDERPDDEDEGA